MARQKRGREEERDGDGVRERVGGWVGGMGLGERAVAASASTVAGERLIRHAASNTELGP